MDVLKVKQNEFVKDLKIIAHINDNIMYGNEKGTGLVAYALLCEKEKSIIFLIRGSESKIDEVNNHFISLIKNVKIAEIFTSIDWLDNFNMINNDSIQFKPLSLFVEKVMKDFGKTYSYTSLGHSKGGGLSIFLGGKYENIKAISVDGVGMPAITFSENPNYAKNITTNDKVINYVAGNDIVGKMLVHLEKIEYLEMVTTFKTEKDETLKPKSLYGCLSAHYPKAIFLDKQNNFKRTKHFYIVPAIIGIINNHFMLKILHDKLQEKFSQEQKAHSKELLKTSMEKSIAISEKLSKLL